ncbi:hypothetical protein [Streptomyces fuscichromogenes]|uniref:Uncharacterized protein n=1 Tax=Streptomyces fuscichromogenes TaxID=1324013 RepID=A0A917XQI9_9ACTN|nr:hypothetical protein [Streptomyces fuscichromogenes]GGN46738.1 hypothetical protein GCM10011578_099830 [Streptomyces fuscichromogenes]
MTKSGNDHLKRQAREIARASGRRFPDVLAELRRAPATAVRRPSTELVLVCRGLAHPIDGGRCRREAGHQNLDGSWGWCSWEPGAAVLVWAGYLIAQDQARRAAEDARRAALTPQERAAEDAEAEAEYRADMAYEGSEPYDWRDDKYYDDDPQDDAEDRADAGGDPYITSYLEAR